MEEQAQTAAPKRREAAKLNQTLTVAKRIGRGRLGVVYAAVHSVLARRFAVKVLRPALTRNDAVQQRLRHMIREASQVEHAHVVSLVDFGQLPDQRFYLTMDFVRGIQLSKVLERDGRLPIDRALPILTQTAEGLAAANRQRVAHGDLKPSNVMLVDDSTGNEEGVRLIDFRLSPALSSGPQDDDPMAHLLTYGGVDYLSPEQIAGRTWDTRTDIYALGCLAYRMLTGQPPFVGDAAEVAEAHRNRDPVPPSRRSGGESVSSALDAIVLRCLEKNPGDRYKSMDELLWELRGLMPRPIPTAQEEEEITGRWQIPEVEDEEGAEEEVLPDSPGRLRRLFYETIYELAQTVVDEDVANDDLQREFSELQMVREEATQLAAQAELAENRFEDIRRELRERESTLRYAIIDLNLAKSDKKVRGGRTAEDLDFQISELERSLAQLERQRRDRFAALNSDLQETRDRLKKMEHAMAVHYRRLYAELDEVRQAVITQEARNLYRRLERCRVALSQAQPDTEQHSKVRPTPIV